MGFENKYPYTDLHELNLDWILGVVKRLESEWPEYKTALETEWNNYKDSLTGEGGEWPTFKAAVETTISNFIHDVVGPYNENMNYQPGMFCYYNGNVYKCMTGSSAAYPRPFNSYNWFSYSNQDTNSIVNDLYNYLSTELSSQNTKIYSWIMNTAAQWDSETSYIAGDYCSAIVGGFGVPPTWRYFKCLQDCTNIDVLDTDYWEEVVFASDVAERIAAYKQAMQDQYDAFLEDYQRQFGVVQTTGSSTTDVMSQKAITDELDAIDDQIEKIKTGETIVGKSNLANNFDSKMVLTDNSGYLYRTTGGSREVGEQNRVKKIVGASVPIIQLLADTNSRHIVTTSAYTWNNLGSANFSLANNHIYIISLIGKTVANGQIRVRDAAEGIVGQASPYISMYKSSNTTNDTTYIQGYWDEGNTDAYLSVLDLTSTFGTTVANRLYALEQAQAGTGIAKAKEILVKDYYPYNVTAFTHVKTSGKVNNGFNQWDEQWEVGDISNDTGAKTPNANAWRSKDYLEIFPSTTYYAYNNKRTANFRVFYYDDNNNYLGVQSIAVNATFTTPANATKMLFRYASAHIDGELMCFNLHWDGERDGDYEPYQEWNYPVQDIELKGILSLDAQDNWVADGDEYLPSGVVTENIKELVFNGTGITWARQTNGNNIYYFVTNIEATPVKSPSDGKWRCNNLIPTAWNYSSATTYDGTIGFTSGRNTVCIVPPVECADATAFNTWLASHPVTLEFILETPTESSADSYTELQNDSNWGTEKWIDERDVPMPVFSTCEYIPDLKAKEEAAPESPTVDGDYIMHRENGLNSYGSLSTWLSENGYNKLASITDYDATKTQTLKNVQGVFTWVDD